MAILRHRESDEITYDDDVIYELRDPVEVPEDPTDTLYLTKTGETLRNIAYAKYGDARWWWILADLNRIVDPFAAIEEGKTIRCPSRTRMQGYVL